METERTNARILIEPHVARLLTERHGAPLRGRNSASRIPNRASVINRDLGRYYALLQEAQRRIRARFDDGEKALIVEALQSTYTATWQIGMLATEVQEWIEESDDGPVDAAAHRLVTKLAALTPTEELAVVDAVERFNVWGVAKHRSLWDI